jgi:hypothetical protein
MKVQKTFVRSCDGSLAPVVLFIFNMFDLFRFISFVLNLHSVTIVNTAKIFPETNHYENEPIEMSVRNIFNYIKVRPLH